MFLGKTRQINFYNIDDSFYFVDLPGYGFSKMSKEEQVKSGIFIEDYLKSRQEIALVVFLIDMDNREIYIYSKGDVDFEYDGFTNLTTNGYTTGALAMQDLSNKRINAVILDLQPSLMIAESINK
mgnify:CR=1 FL=1